MDTLKGTRAQLTIPELLEHRHDFVEVVRITPVPRWAPA